MGMQNAPWNSGFNPYAAQRRQQSAPPPPPSPPPAAAQDSIQKGGVSTETLGSGAAPSSPAGPSTQLPAGTGGLPGGAGPSAQYPNNGGPVTGFANRGAGPPMPAGSAPGPTFSEMLAKNPQDPRLGYAQRGHNAFQGNFARLPGDELNKWRSGNQ